MPSISDSKNPDDVRLHLETILAADQARAEPEPGETELDARIRTSVRLRPALRERISAAFQAVNEAVPGISAAENKKLQASHAARAARSEGAIALSRVDSHLASVTDVRNPTVGHNYGVYGSNPTSFAGVYRALLQSQAENTRIAALPATDPDRRYLFTPVIEAAINDAAEHLGSVMGDRTTTRATLSRKAGVKNDVMIEARSSIAAVRNHLYANLPRGKQDRDLHEYGFIPTKTRGAARSGTEPEVEEAETETVVGAGVV